MEFEHTQAFCLMSPVLRGSLDMTTDIAQYRAHIQSWKRVAVSLGLHHPYWVYSALEAFLSVRVQLPYGFRVPEFWAAFLEYWDALCARHGAQDPGSDWIPLSSCAERSTARCSVQDFRRRGNGWDTFSQRARHRW